MATLTVQQITRSGLAETYDAAAAGGDDFANDGRTFLRVKNGGVGSINVTINSVANCDQGFDHDLVVAVANGVDKFLGPFIPTTRFNDSGTGRVGVTYSGVTTVTVAALKIGTS